jgi:hypothetical protein
MFGARPDLSRKRWWSSEGAVGTSIFCRVDEFFPLGVIAVDNPLSPS